jgi:hypothetical protein
MLYETDKRETQENREILVYKLPTNTRTRSPIHGFVCCGNAGLCLVGCAGIVILNNRSLGWN